MSWLHEIATCPPIRVYSQNGEEGPLFFILERLGMLDQKSMLVVDFGAGDGDEMSNSRLLMDRGWIARRYDIDPRGAKDIIKTNITINNARQYAIGCNVLLIDIDGNDFWILAAVLSVTAPAVIVCEINTRFEREESKAMGYDPDHIWDGTDGYGMSVEAAIRLGKQHRYSPVHLHNNQNLFLVRDNLLPMAGSMGPLAPLPNIIYKQDTITHPESKTVSWIQVQ